MPHVWPTHGGTLDYFRNEYQGHINVQYQGGHHRMPDLANTRMDLVTWYTGPGLLLSRMVANFESLQFINNTPVEDGITKVWTGVLVNTGKPQPTAEDLANCVVYQDANLNAFAQDFEIWANKAPCKQILQIPTDGPFGHGRRWYSQFYKPRAEAAAIHAKTNGVVFTKGMNPIVPDARTLALGDVAPFVLWRPEGPEFKKAKTPEPAE
jgi:3-ketosteroid 9alpha-monooxygenase subunit A